VFQSRFNLFEDFKDRDQVYGNGYTNVRQVTLKFTLGILHDEAVRLNTNAVWVFPRYKTHLPQQVNPLKT
jgi:hypothetical protein